MEILIGLVIACVAGWWLFFRNNEQAETPAPYKVDTPPAPIVETKVEEPAPVPVVELASTPVTLQITDAVTQAPAKKPRKPRAPKVEAPVAKPAAKKAAPAKKAAVKKPAARSVVKSKKA
jgi:hypothetical protein